MPRSWLRPAGALAVLAGLLVLCKSIFLGGSPHGSDLVLAGGLYTLAFAARMSG